MMTSRRGFGARSARRLLVRAGAQRAVRRFVPWAVMLALAVILGVAGWPPWWFVTSHQAKGAMQVGEILVAAEVAALLLWRAPLLCFLVAEVALVIYGVRGYPSTPANYAGLVATGIAGWGCRSWMRYGTLLAAVVGTLIIGLGEPGGAPWQAIVANLLLVVGAWIAGWGVRGQQEAHRARLAAAADAEVVRLAEERLSMAAALHDRVGNTIAAATRQLESAEVLDAQQGLSVTRRANTRLRAALAEIAELVGSWSAEASGAGAAIEQNALLPHGEETKTPGEQLFARVQGWIAVLSASGVDVALRIGGGPVLDSLQERLLGDALDEALANVVKHSDAPCVAVDLQQGSDDVSLRVHDGGPPRVDAGPSSGTGLARLERRLVALGGSLSAEANPDGGFELVVVLPKIGR